MVSIGVGSVGVVSVGVGSVGVVSVGVVSVVDEVVGEPVGSTPAIWASSSGDSIPTLRHTWLESSVQSD